MSVRPRVRPEPGTGEQGSGPAETAARQGGEGARFPENRGKGQIPPSEWCLASTAAELGPRTETRRLQK